jgi:hypothetical protein
MRVIETEVLGFSFHSLVRIPAKISWLVQRIVLHIFGWGGGEVIGWDRDRFQVNLQAFSFKTEEDDEKAKSG